MTALSEIPLDLGLFDNVSEFGPGTATATVEAAPFDNVNEFGGIELVVAVDAAPFDNASGFGGVTVDIEVAVDAAPFDNVSEYGAFTLSTDVLAAPFDDASATFGGVSIAINVSVSATPFDNTADHKFGPTEYCVLAYPGFETAQSAFVTATSGTETYTDVFGRAPDAGDLLLFVVLAQNVAFTPTITGFTLVSTITSGGTACVALFTRLATGSEGTTISYSGWTGASGTDWDFAGGIIVPDGEHFGTADSETVQATASVTTGTTSPAISTSWGPILMNAYSAIVTAGSTTPIPVPSGYTQRFLQNFASGDTQRRVAIASKAVDGDSETPGAWNTTGASLTWAVRGPETCNYGGLSVDSPPFDNVTDYGGVFIGSEVPIFSAPFDNVSEYGGIDIAIDNPIVVNLYEYTNVNIPGPAAYETYPIIYSSAATISVEDVDSTHEVTLPLAGTGDFYVMIITYTGATPSVAGFTLVNSLPESGGIPGMAIFKRVVTGSEGSTVTVTTDVGATCISHVFNILGSSNTLDVSLRGATADPPQVSFTEPYALAIAACGVSVAGAGLIADPTGGYVLLFNSNNEAGTPMDLRSAWKGSLSVSPHNPTIFSSTVPSLNHIVCTIVVHGRDQTF